MSETYAVFEMREWQRSFRPVEIFDNLETATRFAEKIKEGFYVYPENTGSGLDWRVYRRSATDWEIVKG